MKRCNNIKNSLLITVLLSVMVLVISGCNSSNNEKSKLVVGVSIPPQEAFVKAVAGSTVDIVTIIPKGFSPANYEPSPRELILLEQSNIYYSIGVPAEKNILPKLSMDKKDIINLQEIVSIEYPLLNIEEHSHDHDEEEADHEDEHEGEKDPHIWMSPKRVIVIIKEIERTLSELDPDNSSFYKSNADSYIDQLGILDKYIKSNMKGSANNSFIIYHPSLGYFADDYNLNMLSIEDNGKDATINSIKSIIEYAKEHNIKTIFYQEEFSSSQAEVIAREINGKVVPLDILSNNYIENIKYISTILFD